MRRDPNLPDPSLYYRDTSRRGETLHQDCVPREHHPHTVEDVTLIRGESPCAFTEGSMLAVSVPSNESNISAGRLQNHPAKQDTISTNALASQDDTNSVKSELSSEVPDMPSQWVPAVHIPGSRKGKMLYLGAKVQSPGCDPTICNQKFGYFSGLLNATINSRQNLRDDVKLRKSTSYHLYMVGTTPETARPSVVVFCRKEYSKQLRSLFGHRLQGQLNCNTRGLRSFVHRFRHDQQRDAKFNLVCFCSDLNPVDRKVTAPDLPNEFFPNGPSESSIALDKVFTGLPTHWAGVFMVSSSRGILKGHILASKSMLGSIMGDEPCQAWTVILEPGTPDVTEEEYGSLIIDQVSNEVYGHVIDRGPLGQVYVSPMKQVQHQIDTRSEDQVLDTSQPTTPDISSEFPNDDGLSTNHVRRSEGQGEIPSFSEEASQWHTVQQTNKMADGSQNQPSFTAEEFAKFKQWHRNNELSLIYASLVLGIPLTDKEDEMMESLERQKEMKKMNKKWMVLGPINEPAQYSIEAKFDTGADLNYITEGMVQLMGLEKKRLDPPRAINTAVGPGGQSESHVLANWWGRPGCGGRIEFFVLPETSAITMLLIGVEDKNCWDELSEEQPEDAISYTTLIRQLIVIQAPERIESDALRAAVQNDQLQLGRKKVAHEERIGSSSGSSSSSKGSRSNEKKTTRN